MEGAEERAIKLVQLEIKAEGDGEPWKAAGPNEVEDKCGDSQNVIELGREEGMSEPETLDSETSLTDDKIQDMGWSTVKERCWNRSHGI